MGILGGDPKDEPLHFGEIYDLWQFSMKAKSCISSYQVYLNHAGDKDLKRILGDLLDQARLEAKECDEILINNGIVPFPVQPERPEAKLEDIPIGARFMDQEIALMIGADNSMSMIACSQIMGKSIREDVASLFDKYHATKAALGLRILRLTKEKGWLLPPPLQIKRPELAHV